MNITYTDNLVIGAGVAGLTFSALMAHSSEEVILLERHSLPGGCAGYFSRSGFTFDVGATTLSGIGGVGSLKKIIDILNLKLPLRHIDPGLIIHLDGRQLKRSSNLSSWIKEQQEYFNLSWIESLWQLIEKRNHDAVKLAKYSASFPINSGRDFLDLASGDYKLKLNSLYRMFQSFHQMHPDISKDLRYQRMIDEMLLIAAQNNAKSTPALISYMALSYLEDCWYCQGGMKGLIQNIENKVKQQKSSVQYRQEVQEISKRFNYFEVKTQKSIFRTKKVISALPIWNTLNLASSFPLKKVYKAVKRFTPKWGAITGYFSIKTKTEITDLYHQVHIDKPLNYTNAQSVFVSLCPLSDMARTKGFEQTATLSIHIDLEKYREANFNIPREDLKKKWEQEFVVVLQKTFYQNILDLTCHGIGDPKTFEHFTGRYLGSVGGLPHDVRHPLLFYPQFDTGVENFYQLGDTTFPGQGIVGVMQGALNLFHRFGKM